MTTSASTADASFDLAATAESIKRLREEVGKVVIGQHSVIEQMMLALISRGHCLLIGVPGLAKTVMAKALADALEMQFKRVQFTPDLMPSDITGTNVLQEDPDTGRKSFQFMPGPVFTNVLLADEINRTPPKTQASLLEAMQERRVTFGGEQRPLPDPFIVLATQNPLEQEGTYPLPEAQLDRFMLSVLVTYPSHMEENQIVSATTERRRPVLTKVLGVEQVRAMQRLVRELPVDPKVVRYAVALARATRPGDSSPEFIKKYVDCGAGPRAGQFLVLAAKSRAVLAGRTDTTIDDVKASAQGVLRHRVFTNFTALSEDITTDELVKKLVHETREGEGGRIVHAVPDTSAQPAVKLSAGTDAVAIIRDMKAITQRVRDEVGQMIVGQADVIDLVITALLAGGHCLLVGVPGLAKTTLVQTLASVLDLDFKRVQFTPDLMPTDITGTDVMEINDTDGRRVFRFLPGPIFTNMLLADEINRTPPKTQAALLEAMQEMSVTSGNTTYPLKPPFFVLATQNPLEQEGTYPLPEAQLDRFMFNIHLDYPSSDEETVIVDRTTGSQGRPPGKVIGGEEIMRLQEIVRLVPVSKHVLTYATTLARMTRPETKGCPAFVTEFVHCGAGPRAAQNLILGAKARAVMQGRPNVSVADIKAVAIPVLRHRIFTNFSADAEGVTAESLVKKLLKTVTEPKMEPAEREREPEAESESAIRQADAFTVTCSKCGKTLKLSRRAVGRNAKCPNCKHVFPVEAPGGSHAAEPETEETP